MKNKKLIFSFTSIVLSLWVLLTGFVPVKASPAGPCSVCPDTYHHIKRGTFQSTIVVHLDTNNDGKEDNKRIFYLHECYCGALILTSGFPQDPYGIVGDYIAISQQEFSGWGGAGHTDLINSNRINHNQYYNLGYTEGWHFKHDNYPYQ